ncbi:hypothetical protein [Nocardioides aurantiacus]|uniref:hypothetical protein n=1 Tax=Nocardioides aurantiacus TaxID=86796 RepID=UPI00403FAAE7
MSNGQQRPEAPRPRRGAFDLPQVPWTMLAILGAGVLLLDALGAPIGYRVQIAGLLALGIGAAGSAVTYSWVRRRP